jgi:hypothetical protein
MFICENCSERFEPLRKRRTQKWCPNCNQVRNRPTAQQYKSHGRNPEAFLRWKHSKLRDPRRRANKIDVDVTIDELIAMYRAQKGKCAVTGLPLSHDPKDRLYSNISIDRIDPKGGYTKKNIRLVMKIVNTIRNVWSDDDLYRFVEQAYEGMRKIRKAVT